MDAEDHYAAVKDVLLSIVDDSVDEEDRETLGLLTERTPGDGASDWTDLVDDTGTATTTDTDGGLEPGTTRYYRVSAINLVGTGPASDPAGATTDRGEPAEVRVAVAVVDANGVVVTEVPEDIGTATIRVTATTGRQSGADQRFQRLREYPRGQRRLA